MNTLEFAEYELRRYAAQMGISPAITLKVDPRAFSEAPFVRFDPSLDDAFRISVKNGAGSIFATNPRAVLLGVYRFLTLQGCRFIRPGKDGEYIPYTAKVEDCEETVSAATRHRGIEDYGCNGGIEAMLALIDWLPKIMMNSYFTELTDQFWNMYFSYRDKQDPFHAPREVTGELFDLWMERLNAEIQKRGLFRHSAGHGWTVMLMEGVEGAKFPGALAALGEHPVCTNPEVLPLIKGERKLWDGVPLNTHLCFSNDRVRAEFVKHVCDYSEEHPEVDYLHVWLGDAFANFCECENCAKMTPTDWYVKLLNELDEELTRRASKQKIVFLVYFELLYAPTVEKIKNEDRFTLLFCPYGRDFTVRYRDVVPEAYTPKRNNTFTWGDMRGELYLKQLSEWKECFHGDSLVFDYTMYDDASYLDLVNLNTAALLADDCIYIKKMGLNGRIECGDTRAMTPTALCLHTMAHSLFFGKELSKEAFFRDTFGEGEPISQFLESIREVIPPEMIRRRRKEMTEKEVLAMEDALARLREFRVRLFAYSPAEAFHRQSCHLFSEDLSLLELVLECLLEKHRGMTPERLSERREELRRLLYRLEQTSPLTVSPRRLFTHWSDFLAN